MNFDRLAPHYDWLEALLAGNRLQRARTAWLGELRGRLRILSVGEGHGRFAAACATRFPEAEITCVESSPKMLACAQARTRNTTARIRWHCCDLRAWTPVEKYDVVVTCFFLDCFPPETLAEVVTMLAGSAKEDALWLNVDFSIPPRGLARWRARAVHALMYAFFRRAVALPAWRLTPPDDLLRAQGFQLVRCLEFEWGLLRAEHWRRG
jgi:ubiquinone/menaquinone biosynthesis C-methylase UbiE